MKIRRIAGAFGLLFTLAAEITVVPEMTDEILANPGMGWQTFHRTARQDKHLPDWIPSMVHYALALHGSQINNKSAPIPEEGPEVRAEVERFLRRLG